MSFDLWSSVIAAFFCVILGVFSYLKNKNSLSNQSFAIFNFALAAWNPTDLLKFVANHHTALIWYRLSYIGGSFIPFAFMMFMWAIVDRKPTITYRIIKWAAILSAGLFQTNLMIRDIQISISSTAPIEEIHGPLYNLFPAIFVPSLLYSLVPLIFNYKNSSGTTKKQLEYILFAFFLGFIAIINFFANQINNQIPPLFYLFQMGISATFAVAIMKHRLLDITIIIRKTIIYSLVTGAVTIIYLVMVTILTRISTAITGHWSDSADAIAAVIAMLAFQPLRKRTQSFIDVRFFRQFVDREEKLYELSREVITHTTPDEMATALIKVLGESMHPKSAALYLRSREGNHFNCILQDGDSNFPKTMNEDDLLPGYFVDHPQPFVQDAPTGVGDIHNTRTPLRREDVA